MGLHTTASIRVLGISRQWKRSIIEVRQVLKSLLYSEDVVGHKIISNRLTETFSQINRPASLISNYSIINYILQKRFNFIYLTYIG